MSSRKGAIGQEAAMAKQTGKCPICGKPMGTCNCNVKKGGKPKDKK